MELGGKGDCGDMKSKGGKKGSVYQDILYSCMKFSNNTFKQSGSRSGY